MATYRVVPLPDGVSQRGSWQVQKNGTRVSTHLKKNAAKQKAKREAGARDNVVVHRVDGTVMGN